MGSRSVTAGSCPNAFTASFSQNTNRLDNYSYDAAGNLLNDGVHSYAYDNESRIISVDGGATATYSYDPMGQRVETNAGGTKTDFIYLPDGRVVDEYEYSSGYNGGIMSFAYLGNRTIAEYRNGTTYFIFTDHLGSTRIMTDVNGQVDPNGVFDYMPFGETLVASTLTTHKFTSKERDAESGLDYFGARHYTSMMGRFMSADWSAIPEPVPYAKFNEPQTLNLYTYTGNNPVSLTDPDGHTSGITMNPENDPPVEACEPVDHQCSTGPNDAATLTGNQVESSAVTQQSAQQSAQQPAQQSLSVQVLDANADPQTHEPYAEAAAPLTVALIAGANFPPGDLTVSATLNYNNDQKVAKGTEVLLNAEGAGSSVAIGGTSQEGRVSSFNLGVRPYNQSGSFGGKSQQEGYIHFVVQDSAGHRQTVNLNVTIISKQVPGGLPLPGSGWTQRAVIPNSSPQH